jgi:hypothetical protein
MNADEATELLGYAAFVVAVVDRDTLSTPNLLLAQPVLAAKWRLFVQEFDAYRAKMQAQLNAKRGYVSPVGVVGSGDATAEGADIGKMLGRAKAWEAAWRQAGANIADTSRKEPPGRLEQVLGADAATAIKGTAVLVGLGVVAYLISSTAGLVRAVKS